MLKRSWIFLFIATTQYHSQAEEKAFKWSLGGKFYADAVYQVPSSGLYNQNARINLLKYAKVMPKAIYTINKSTTLSLIMNIALSNLRKNDTALLSGNTYMELSNSAAGTLSVGYLYNAAYLNIDSFVINLGTQLPNNYYDFSNNSNISPRFNTVYSVLADSYQPYAGRSLKVSYLSPSFTQIGIRLGASYTPSVNYSGTSLTELINKDNMSGLNHYAMIVMSDFKLNKAEFDVSLGYDTYKAKEGLSSGVFTWNGQVFSVQPVVATNERRGQVHNGGIAAKLNYKGMTYFAGFGLSYVHYNNALAFKDQPNITLGDTKRGYNLGVGLSSDITDKWQIGSLYTYAIMKNDVDNINLSNKAYESRSVKSKGHDGTVFLNYKIQTVLKAGIAYEVIVQNLSIHNDKNEAVRGRNNQHLIKIGIGIEF